MKKLIFVIVSLVVLCVSCDTYDTDLEPKLNVIKATTGSFANIRASSYFKDGESFEISTPPKDGFTFFNSGVDSEYLLYGSNSDFESNDSFSVTARNGNGQVIETQNFLITRASSCGRGSVRDTVNVQVGQTVVIDLLMSDFFCDTEFAEAAISEGVRGGDGGTLNYSIDKSSKSITLTFQAGDAPGQYLYSGYTLGLNPNFDLSASAFDWRDHPEKFERFQSVLINFNVIE